MNEFEYNWVETAKVETGETKIAKCQDGLELTKDELLSVLESSPDSFFITGSAGSGKSTVLREFAESASKRLNIAVLAFTGLAAINVGGQTIHSFFGISPFDKYDRRPPMLRPQKEDILSNIDVLIIDEISMVPLGLFERMDYYMRLCRVREKPFGGAKVLLFGDYYQLPPVSDSTVQDEAQKKKMGYAFKSGAYQALSPKNVVLTHNWRQHDGLFLQCLDSIRKKDAGVQKALATLNERVKPLSEDSLGNGMIVLTTTNKKSDEINQRRLRRIEKRLFSFPAEVTGNFIDPSKPGRRLPADQLLQIKVDAQVIFIRNDPAGRWVNGSIGKVVGLDWNMISVQLIEDDVVVQLSEQDRAVWEKKEHVLQPAKNKIKSVTTGTFVQYPLRLAWSITIHKSQGQTLPSVYLDFSDRAPWDHGQLYVALSRCRELTHLHLRDKLLEKDVIVDESVRSFLRSSGLEEMLGEKNKGSFNDS